MVEFQDLPERPRNSGYHARRWSRKSGGLASIDTGRSHLHLNSAPLRAPFRQCPDMYASCWSFVILLKMPQSLCCAPSVFSSISPLEERLHSFIALMRSEAE